MLPSLRVLVRRALFQHDNDPKHLHLHLVILQTLLSKATYNWGIHKAKSRRGKHTEEVPITPSLRHCSNKYKLAREGEKEKDEHFEKVIFFFFFFFNTHLRPLFLNTHLRPLLDFWRRTGWKWFSGQVCLLIWTQSNTYGEFWRDKLSITLHPASNL